MRDSAPKPNDRWDKIYTRCFKNQPEGYAVYEKLSTKQMKPGMSGYFDTSGKWQMIADLTGPTSEGGKGLGLTAKQRTDEVEQYWPFRKSEGMQKVSSGLEGMGQYGGQGGGVDTTYESTTKEGAILLTQGIVENWQISPNHKLVEWMESNAKDVLLKHPDAKNHGLWIINNTYSVPKRAFAISKSKGTKVTFNINAQASAQDKVKATGSWWASKRDEIWTTQENKTGAGVVLAFDGVYWKPTWYPWGRKPKTKRQADYLAGDQHEKEALYPIPIPSSDEQDSGQFVLVPEIFGKDLEGTMMLSPSEEDDDDDESDDCSNG